MLPVSTNGLSSWWSAHPLALLVKSPLLSSPVFSHSFYKAISIHLKTCYCSFSHLKKNLFGPVSHLALLNSPHSLQSKTPWKNDLYSDTNFFPFIYIYIIIIYFFFSWGHLLHCFFRERKGKRETLMRERSISRLPPICTWIGDWNPQPMYLSWWGIEPVTRWLQDDTPTSWATLARASPPIIFWMSTQKLLLTGYQWLPSGKSSNHFPVLI